MSDTCDYCKRPLGEIAKQVTRGHSCDGNCEEYQAYIVARAHEGGQRQAEDQIHLYLGIEIQKHAQARDLALAKGEIEMAFLQDRAVIEINNIREELAEGKHRGVALPPRPGEAVPS